MVLFSTRIYGSPRGAFQLTERAEVKKIVCYHGIRRENEEFSMDIPGVFCNVDFACLWQQLHEQQFSSWSQDRLSHGAAPVTRLSGDFRRLYIQGDKIRYASWN